MMVNKTHVHFCARVCAYLFSANTWEQTCWDGGLFDGKSGAPVPPPPEPEEDQITHRPHNNLPVYIFLIYALIYTLEIIHPM